MRRTVVLLWVTAAVALGAAAASGGTDGRASAAIVSRVIDGDTLDLRDGRRVRLLQVDTPEVGTGECYSRKARTQLVALAPPGGRVVLEVDPALNRVDRYGRVLRYLRVGGLNVNLELVRRGAAAPYFYRGEQGRYAAALLRAARASRAGGRGLWGACPVTPLDPFRAVDTGTSGPSYAGVCIPPSPPDLDCADIRARGFAPVRVVGAYPHRLDGDGDGWGCE
ncbi:MAG: thermonuclease family protein [Gaiella sp.]